MILSYDFNNNIPAFKCTLCGKCSKILESTSYTHIKNRGCCWYFPEYRLIDIKNIIDNNNIHFILHLASLSNSIIKKYSIMIQGTFFKNKYMEFIKIHTKNTSFNESLFFKLCPFLGDKGCKLNFLLRPHPCNLYLCRHVIELCGQYYSSYCRERKDYYAYCSYCNECIKEDLKRNNTNLSENMEKSLYIIKESSISNFCSQNLSSIQF
ncbi:hypothetical protein ACSVC9_01830 [Clostridium sp. LBM24168]